MTGPEYGITKPNGGSHTCPRCGGFYRGSKLLCSHCNLNINTFDKLVEQNSDDILWVGGSGYGVGGAYSDTFHALDEFRTQSQCGRLEYVSSSSVPEGLSWAVPVLTLTATASWQSTPCGHCENLGAFSRIDREPDEVKISTGD